MGDFAAIFIGACLVNNLILDAMLGLPPAIAVSKKIETATGMALAMSIALVITTVITYPLYSLLLVPAGLENLQTFIFIIVITTGIKLADVLIKSFKPVLHDKVAAFVPLTIINSAALGAATINIQASHGIIGSLFFGLGAAAGYGGVIIALSAMHERIMETVVPAPFRGIAIRLISLGIMAMAFMGFKGVVNL